jgi:hypothetical protein
VKSVDVCHVSAKKSRFGQKKLVCHGRESRLRGRLPGSPAARPYRRPALRLRVTESQARALSLYLSLSPEALFPSLRGSLRVTRLTRRVTVTVPRTRHSVPVTRNLKPGPGPAAAGAAGAAAAGSVTDQSYRDDPWKT